MAVTVIRNKVYFATTTPTKEQFPQYNRAERRSMFYTHPVRRLLAKIEVVRKDIRKLGVRTQPPKFNNRKFLSGYYGRLCELGRKRVRDITQDTPTKQGLGTKETA